MQSGMHVGAEGAGRDAQKRCGRRTRSTKKVQQPPDCVPVRAACQRQISVCACVVAPCDTGVPRQRSPVRNGSDRRIRRWVARRDGTPGAPLLDEGWAGDDCMGPLAEDPARVAGGQPSV